MSTQPPSNPNRPVEVITIVTAVLKLVLVAVKVAEAIGPMFG